MALSLGSSASARAHSDEERDLVMLDSLRRKAVGRDVPHLARAFSIDIVRTSHG